MMCKIFSHSQCLTNENFMDMKLTCAGVKVDTVIGVEVAVEGDVRVPG